MTDSSPETTLELLKLFFGADQSGEWEIQSIFGVSLKPASSAKDGFFKIEDDLVTAQPAIFGTTGSILGQSIVPIVAQVNGENTLRCIGTGFFVSCTGLLITAAHVITDPIERQYGGTKEIDSFTWQASELKFGVLIRLNPLTQGDGYVFRNIEWATFLASRTEAPIPIADLDLRLTSDTAICKVPQLAVGVPYQPLAIVQSGIVGTGMTVGKTATAVGYGEMKDVELTQNSDGSFNGDFSFDLHASTGKIIERFPNNLVERQVPTPGACFSGELLLPGGMSGSPIFDDEGIYVHGVVSKGWVDESGPTRFGFGSMLAHSMSVPIRSLGGKTLLDLHKEKEHGFPKFSGPDI